MDNLAYLVDKSEEQCPLICKPWENTALYQTARELHKAYGHMPEREEQ
jgi:hypothetical protein